LEKCIQILVGFSARLKYRRLLLPASCCNQTETFRPRQVIVPPPSERIQVPCTKLRSNSIPTRIDGELYPTLRRSVAMSTAEPPLLLLPLTDIPHHMQIPLTDKDMSILAGLHSWLSTAKFGDTDSGGKMCVDEKLSEKWDLVVHYGLWQGSTDCANVRV